MHSGRLASPRLSSNCCPVPELLGRIVDLSTAPTASGNEDVVLDLVLKAGFEHPLVNALYPGSRYIPDLWWPEPRLIVEVDSREWHSDPIAQRDDLDRQAWLEARGERVLRTTKPQVLKEPHPLLRPPHRRRSADVPLSGSGLEGVDLSAVVGDPGRVAERLGQGE